MHSRHTVNEDGLCCQKRVSWSFEREVELNFKDKLNDPTRILTTDVVVIPSAVVTQAVAAAGLDAVIIDQEHGAVGRDSMHAMIAATAGTDCAQALSCARFAGKLT